MTDTNIPRMPQPTPALALVILGLEIERDDKGAVECERRIIGARRQRLGPPSEDAPQRGGQLSMVYDGLRIALAHVCAECKFERCPWKRITPPHS